ncbi:MAG: acd [Nocardia sp.]|uniref:acyl-CoA dehydrogenase family protein n=1 Tax=Nocardia sp. TaxID=1821 RepID=UPI00261C289B|nr:acyl-CoA dehydrogenase family protein [Nocardia sp.]MCU1641344.1 acd [Nocardia sp.]
MSLDEFRTEARAWLETNATPFAEAGGDLPASIEECKRFQNALWQAGFAGITWPEKYGGQGLGAAELLAFTQEAADFSLPTQPFIIGLGMPGPTILELGTEEQKLRYLPSLLRGEEIWCQLFSEPGTGSDVASLRTTATRTEDGWVINGQKIWTSGAQWSDFGAIIARTDPTVPKHQGITMFIVDMHSPGVTVRPLVVATGDAAFNEVFFDDVRVPADAVIGEVNQGWAAAVVMLRNERVAIGAGGRRRADPLGFDALLEVARSRGRTGDPAVRRRLAELYARESSVTAFGRLLHEETIAGQAIGARGSAAKLAGAELSLWAAEFAGDLLGAELALGYPEVRAVAGAVIAAPGYAIAGGTNEIQRNIIGERILGLPKDPGIQRDVPFNQLRLSR